MSLQSVGFLVCLSAAAYSVYIDAEWYIALAPTLAALYLLYRLLFGSWSAPPLKRAPSQQPAPPTEDLSKPKATIIYASQTGTAELNAKTLMREAKKVGFRVALHDTADYDENKLAEEKFVIFCVATYGEGEPTDTMKDFHSWLMSEDRMDDDPLSGVKYCVFGLGDSQYKHFCQMGIEVDQRMTELGAERICDLGKGDSDKNMEEDFDTWKAEMWQKAAPLFGIEPKDEFAEPPEQMQKIQKVIPPPAKDPLPFPTTSSSFAPSQKLPCWGVITRNDELLSASERSTKHIEIDVSSSALNSYEAGDHLGILPCNSDNTVDEYIRLLGLSAEEASEVIFIVNADGISRRNLLPNKVSVRTALKWYFDLQGPPKKSTLRAFTFYTQDPTEQAEFQNLLRLNDESVQKYRALERQLRTVAGFLAKFPSTKVPLGVFMEHMPRINPRWYSIASDSLFHGKSIHMCLAISDGGLCSGYMKDMTLGEKVPCFVRKSTFHLPNRDKTRPLIMIGPGTGVAPLIGFIHRRKAWLAKNHELGECYFYFGCRKRSEDFIYSKVMEEAQAEGVITKLRVAFSRDQEKKVYVQHLLWEDGKEIGALLDKGANVYVCGDAKHMARDVEQTLQRILVEHCGKSTADAAELLNKMERNQRYMKDVWTSH